MKLTRLGEFGLIQRISRSTPFGRGVRIGIGDDAAWVSHPAGSSLVTADLLVERVHFDLRWISFQDLGHKSLAVNLSDIAAMGGTPAYALLSLGIPKNYDSHKIDQFYRGVNALARKSGVAVVGGDISIAESLIVSVCLVGHPPRRPVCRSGARVGDDVYVTGTLGDSALGLKLLRQARGRRQQGHFVKLIARHHKPTPRLKAGAMIARDRLATAMIDVSDGLVQDLGHVCLASNVGAIVLADRLPLSASYRAVTGTDGASHALGGGEDYELLFCSRPKNRMQIEKLSSVLRVRITRIGTCTEEKRVHVVDGLGRTISYLANGHDHFRTRVTPR